MNPNTLFDLTGFLSALTVLASSGKWTARIENNNIRMTFAERPAVMHSPLTAAVYAMTAREVYDANMHIMSANVHGVVFVANFLLLQFIDAERGTTGNSWNAAPIRMQILEAIKPCLAVSK